MFKTLENVKTGTEVNLSEAFANIGFNDDGLVPAIAQDIKSKEVLMMAWMNQKAIQTTLKEGMVCYWSRSRNKLWRKGETSNHFQKLVEMRLDCDGDTVLLLVEQTGPACHTNRPSCFYLSVQGNRLQVIDT
tara:strand:+ start:325 stop:720 length:396 start_codon:yes stop_codon:yes gene_type:complete